jgi:hypothetical protein
MTLIQLYHISKKALVIYKHVFPLTHRDITTTNNDIERLQLILQCTSID